MITIKKEAPVRTPRLPAWSIVFITLCLAFGGVTGSVARAQGSPITVSMWSGALTQEERDVIQQKFADTFNAAHSDVQVELTFIQNEDALRTAVQAGQGPDIIITAGPSVTAVYADAGHLLPLDSYSAKYGWADELVPSFFSAGFYHDKLYSMPLQLEALGTIFYNKTLFDQNGWKAPTTRAELEQLCADVTAKNLLCFTDGDSGSPYPNQYWAGAMFNRFAGADNTYLALTGQKRWDDPVFVQGIQLFKDWVDKGWISGSAEGYFATDDFTDSWSELADGEGAMNNQGTWTFAYLPPMFDDAGNDWDWFLMPQLRDGNDQEYDLSVGTSVSINANSEHPDQAAEVMDWMFNDKARALDITASLGFGEWLVPLKWTSDDFKSANVDDRFLRYIDDFGKLSDQGKVGYTIWTFWGPQTQAYISKELDGVLAGTKSPEEFLQGLQAVADGERSSGSVMTVPQTTAKSAPAS
jgi:raffinose/stachyose/melibiose transport system substrate-binding protein